MGSFNNFIKSGSFHPVKLFRHRLGKKLVPLSHAASQLSVEILLDEIVSARW